MVTFANPLALFGFAGLAVPIVLHLMNRQVPVRIVFPSIRFIRKAQLPREGRRRLRDFLLLLLRLALLSCAVLAVSGPRLRQDAAALGGAADRSLTVVVVDSSSSMRAEGVVQRARETLESVVEELDAGSLALMFSSDRIVSQHGPAGDSALFRGLISAWRPELVAGNHRAALESAGDILEQWSGRRRLVIVSDFRQSDWGIHEAFVPSGVTVELINVGQDSWGNAGLVSAAVTSLAGKRVRVIASVRNFSDVTQSRTVSLEVGGQTRSKQVELPPLQHRRVAFVSDAGDATQGVLRLSADDYTPDDRYFVWLGAVPPVGVLAVTPAEEQSRKATELFFLKKALSVQTDFESVSFHVQAADTESCFALDLSAVRAVFLLGAAGYLREGGFEALRACLQAGGTVICTPGESVAHEYHGLRKQGLIKGRFVTVVGKHDRSSEAYGLSGVNPDGVLGNVFSRPEETDLFLFPIRRYVRFAPDASSTVLLRIGEGEPALIERGVGNGRLFVFMFAFEPSWSDFPMTSVFLPTVRELLASAVPTGYGVRRVACGDALPHITDLLGNPVADREPDRGATREPGILLLGQWPVEVNVPREESTGMTVNAYDLKRTLTGQGAVTQGEAQNATAGTRPGERLIGLWQYFALAAALLILCELFVTGLTDRKELSGRVV